jgi:hypothetical protein
MNKGHKSPAERIETFENWADFAAWMVVVGVIVEAVLAAGVSDRPFVIKWGPTASDIMVALGVAGEILFTRRARTISSELQTESNEKIAAANERAATAIQKAREAELALEKFKAPGRLSPNSQRKVTERIAPFKGQKLNVWVTDPSSTEVMGFWNDILVTLRDAEWEYAAAVPIGLTRSVNGLLLELDPDVSPRDRESGAVLCAALRAEDVVISSAIWTGGSRSGGLTGHSVAGARLLLSIGPKPIDDPTAAAQEAEAKPGTEK